MYIGVTSDLVKRVYEHKINLVEGFTKKYKVHDLIYYEVYDDPIEAMKREKNMKKRNRYWKIKLVNKMNPKWKDLYSEIVK